ncbi:MAG: acyl-CoA thioesterase [Clostridia bacterium]|nr:acyl-CoA thioesterase [Clostridia bacterium]
MTPYVRTVHYYETDMMGLTHHSNYIRYMEEARIDFMEQLGFPYRKMEQEGIVSPVTSVSCRYRRSSTFGDTLSISVTPASFDGVTLRIHYEMRKPDGDLVAEADSEHVFLDREGHFVRMRRVQKEFCDAIAVLIPPA